MTAPQKNTDPTLPQPTEPRVIHESWPWKAGLIRDAEVVARWAARPKRSERRSFLIESKLFLAAYALRKLDEATKLSTATLSNKLKVRLYPPSKPGYSMVNSHRFDDFFDLEHPVDATISGRRLINVIIHSLVFVEGLEDDGSITSFLVTSDQESERGLVEVQLADVLALMRRAAADFPTSFRRKQDAKTGRWKVWTGHEPKARKS